MGHNEIYGLENNATQNEYFSTGSLDFSAVCYLYCLQHIRLLCSKGYVAKCSAEN